MITPIPYQPINFEPLTPCQDSGGCVEVEESCGGTANSYQVRVYPTDQFQFQFDISNCADAEQLLANNNFASDLDDWIQLGDGLNVIDGILVASGNDTIQQNGLITIGVEYLIQIDVLELTGGDITIGIGSSSANNFTITEAGQYQFYLIGGGSNFKMEFFCDTAQVAFVNLFEAPTVNSFEVLVIDGTGATVAATNVSNHNVSNGIATVSFVWSELTMGYPYTEPLADGCYRLRVVETCDEGDELTSNLFCIGSHSGICLIEFRACMDSDAAFGLAFGNFAPSVRIQAVKGYGKHGWDRLLHRNSAGRTTNYFAFGEKTEEVRTERLPEFLLDFLGTLPAYNNVYIDGVEYYVAQDSIDPLYETDEPFLGTLVMEVRKRAQNLKAVKCTAVERSCSPPPNCWIWNGLEGEILWNDNQCVLTNN
jgi:hypothetical protein